jgi:hypothetical protein
MPTELRRCTQSVLNLVDSMVQIDRRGVAPELVMWWTGAVGPTN